VKRSRTGPKPVNLAAPVPLGYVAAVRRALELRALGGHWSWRNIADVMREYHGWDRSPGWWSGKLLAAGAERRSNGGGRLLNGGHSAVRG
jgi:hypothetical protein